MRDRIFEAVFNNGSKIAPSFSDFKKIYERTDFSNVDKTKLSDIYLWGDDSSFFDKDKSLMQALNIDTEDERLMSKMGSQIPTYAAYFSPQAAKKTKSIDLLNAQVELIKVKISQFEKELLSSFTGKEEGEEYEAAIPGLRITTGDSSLSQKLVNGIVKSFSRSFTEEGKSPLKPSIDAFVSGKEGKDLIKLLQQLGVRGSSDRVIDALVKAPLKKIAEQDLKAPMASADNTKLEEINSTTARFEPGMDYMSSTEELNEMDLLLSNDPFVRLGMFYQLCIQQQVNFFDQITPENSRAVVNYSEMLQTGNMMEESIRILFGRKADLSSVKGMLISMGEASKNVVDEKWSSTEMDDLRTALFVPAMQAIYVAMLNFVVMKALYTFLTKRGEIVAASARQETEARTKSSEPTVPSMMVDDKRGKMISRIFNSEPLKKLLDDNIIYREGKPGDEQSIKALKELVYYSFGGPQSPFASIKNWDTTKNPLNGTYDRHFAEIIREIQTAYKIPPIRGGKGDGKVGPNTKEFFSLVIPREVTKLI